MTSYLHNINLTSKQGGANISNESIGRISFSGVKDVKINILSNTKFTREYIQTVGVAVELFRDFAWCQLNHVTDMLTTEKIEQVSTL